MTQNSFFRRPRTYLIGIPVLIVLAVVVGPFVYIHFIQADPPKKLGLPTGTSSTAATGGSGTSAARVTSLDGTWKVAAGSTVGYRVNELLFGQSSTAVGRTNAVTGELTLAGTTVPSASFTADLTKVTSSESRRDDQFQGRIMDTATYPTAKFVLTKPIELTNIPKDLEKISVPATGDLTLKGTTKTVTFTIDARRSGSTIEAAGSIPVTFADYGIGNPSGGPAQTEDHGTLEFLVKFEKAGTG
ncbi:MAG: YceI family protein [Acidimicrobiia bacterium]